LTRMLPNLRNLGRLATSTMLPAPQQQPCHSVFRRLTHHLARPAWCKEPHFAGFQTFLEIPVAWGEQDAYGHVNNVAYFRYLESCRMDFLLQTLGPRLSDDRYRAFVAAKEVGPILAKSSCTYKAPVMFPDVLYAGTRVANMQQDRMEMIYRLVSKKSGRIVAEGDSLIVTYDYRLSKKAPVPAEIEKIFREVVEAAKPAH